MPEKPRQIIALGGGGFSMEPENLALDEYVLAQARVPQPAVGFIPTASGDAEPYIVRFYEAFSGLPCRPSYLPLFCRTPDLREYLLAQDVIYVGGGNTKSLLGVWREWGLPEVLREAWAAGVVLAGVSAGAVCWFEQGLSDAYAEALRPLQCLGFLAGSCCPHYDGEAGAPPHLSRAPADRRGPPRARHRRRRRGPLRGRRHPSRRRLAAGGYRLSRAGERTERCGKRRCRLNFSSRCRVLQTPSRRGGQQRAAPSNPDGA